MTIYNQPMVVTKQGGFLENNFNIITGKTAPTGALKRPVGTFFVLQNPPATPTIYASGGIVNNLGVWVLLGGTAADLNTLTGNTGGVINPVAGNINILGSGDFTVAGAGNTLTISSSSGVNATGNTLNAASSVILTYALSVAKAYSVNIVAFGRDTTLFPGNKGAVSFNLTALVFTDNLNQGFEVQQEQFQSLKSTGLNTATAVVSVSGSNLLVTCTGVAASDIDWRVTGFIREI
jgi:hypothetical protein